MFKYFKFYSVNLIWIVLGLSKLSVCLKLSEINAPIPTDSNETAIDDSIYQLINDTELMLENENVPETTEDTTYKIISLLSTTRNPTTTLFVEQQILQSAPPNQDVIETSTLTSTQKNNKHPEVFTTAVTTFFNKLSTQRVTNKNDGSDVDTADDILNNNKHSLADVNTDISKQTIYTKSEVKNQSLTFGNIKINKHGSRKPLSVETPLNLSILTGVILALLSVLIFISTIFIYKRQEKNSKKETMMNFDLNRMDLNSLRHQPPNDLIVNFPIKRDEEYCHDVKPVTSHDVKPVTSNDSKPVTIGHDVKPVTISPDVKPITKSAV